MLLFPVSRRGLKTGSGILQQVFRSTRWTSKSPLSSFAASNACKAMFGQEQQLNGTRGKYLDLKYRPHVQALGLRTFSTSRVAFEASEKISSKPTTPNKNSKHWWNSESIRSRGPFVRLLIYSIIGAGIISSSIFLLLVGFFIYDATTYNTCQGHEYAIPSIALNPVKGGPKNLPIAYSQIDSDSEELSKPRLVILGTGWGSVATIKELDPDSYNVTVISPTNYFLFTPMLPSATVGTLEFRSLIEPIRRIITRVKGHFLKGEAIDVDFDNRLVEVKTYNKTMNEYEHFYVPYDKLVIAVGSTANTHGVQGLEYCNPLKTVQDARNMRNKIISNLETACLPTTTEEERKRLLSFVICGGGPTGVELAAEIFDILNEDLSNTYPPVLRNLVSVHIIQSRSHILNTYDESISVYAQNRFLKDSVDVLTNSRVERIFSDKVVFNQKTEDGNIVRKELPFGLCIWSTGVALAPLTNEIVQKLGKENQKNSRAIETDPYLRVIGAPLGEVYAVGDCSTVRSDMVHEITAIIGSTIFKKRRYSLNNEEKGYELDKLSLSSSDVDELIKVVRRKHPEASEHLGRTRELFEIYDSDHDGTISFNELIQMLDDVDKKITSLPATAQRASQQGKYLAKKFNKLARAGRVLEPQSEENDVDDEVYRAFGYRHLGSLAYIPGGAVFDMNGRNFFGGLVAMYLWRGVYFTETVSWRTRALLFMDWLKRGLFGRDMADISKDYNAPEEKDP